MVSPRPSKSGLSVPSLCSVSTPATPPSHCQDSAALHSRHSLSLRRVRPRSVGIQLSSAVCSTHRALSTRVEKGMNLQNRGVTPMVSELLCDPSILCTLLNP